MARPTDYKPEFCQEAAEMCEKGATDQELADYFGVDVRTLYRWKNTQAEFRQALRAAKEAADDRVERSLYERALGYERDEVDIKVVQGGIVQTPVRKFYPPDTTAAIFWLKNRKPAEWRDKVENVLSNPDGSGLNLSISFK